MFRTRFLFFFSGLLFFSTFGDSKNLEKFEITDDLKKGNTRTDAQQDPFTSVTLAEKAGDLQSELFLTCIASRPFDAKFASIEVVPGSEYMRYVPDSIQSSVPISWKNVAGNYFSILDCAQAVHDAGWPMFKYNGVNCEATSVTYDLNDVPKCEEKDSDAVFILSSFVPNCALPRFFVGNDSRDKAICGLVSEHLMTFNEAKNFCLNAYPNQELCLFVNEHPPLTLQNATNKLTELGFTKTNLWVNAEERGVYKSDWNGNFPSTDFWNSQFPAYLGGIIPSRSAYIDKDANFKLRVSDMSYKAGALCITFATSGAPE